MYNTPRRDHRGRLGVRALGHGARHLPTVIPADDECQRPLRSAARDGAAAPPLPPAPPLDYPRSPPPPYDPPPPAPAPRCRCCAGVRARRGRRLRGARLRGGRGHPARGRAGRDFYLLVSGTAATKDGAGGQAHAARVQGGDYFGELALLNNRCMRARYHPSTLLPSPTTPHPLTPHPSPFPPPPPSPSGLAPPRSSASRTAPACTSAVRPSSGYSGR